MTTTELLDKVADSAKSGERVAVIAATSKTRETFRKGMARRLEPRDLANVVFLSPHSIALGFTFDAIFVEPDFWSVARTDDVRWFDATVRPRLSAGGHLESAPPLA